jgi:putative ABC transport system substrate-binding protein
VYQESSTAARDLGVDLPQAIATTTSTVLTAWGREFQRFLSANHLPSVLPTRDGVLNGGLMAYGVSYYDQYRKAAEYVDRILRGASPADLPIQQPTTFALIMNVSTVRRLGISVPDRIVQRVTEWIP